MEVSQFFNRTYIESYVLILDKIAPGTMKNKDMEVEDFSVYKVIHNAFFKEQFSIIVGLL